MERRRSLEELYRLHRDAGEWAEAGQLLLKMMERDHGWTPEFFQKVKREYQKFYYTAEESNCLDAEEFIEEQSLGGRTYKER